jgi:hypothetical protein
MGCDRHHADRGRRPLLDLGHSLNGRHNGISIVELLQDGIDDQSAGIGPLLQAALTIHMRGGS